MQPRDDGPPQGLSRWLSGQLRRLLAISASLVSTYAVTGALGLLFWTVAARRFSIPDIGVAGAAVALQTLLGGLGNLGMGTMLISKLPKTAQEHRRVLVRSSMLVTLVASFALTLAVSLLAANIFRTSTMVGVAGTWPAALTLAVGTALTSVAVVLDQAVLVLGTGSSLQFQRNVVASVTKVLALLLLSPSLGGMAIFAAWSIGTAVSLPLVAWRTRGGRALEHPANSRIDLGVVRGHARAAAANYGLNTILMVPVQMLPILVGILLSGRDNGLFTATLRISEFVFVMPYAVSIGLFAVAEGDIRSVLRQMRVSLPMTMGICLSAVVVSLFGARWILAIFGSAYSQEAATVLQLMILASVAIAIKDHFVALRRVQERTGRATIFFLVFAVFELSAAAVGARAGGLVTMVTFWLVVMGVQAVVMGVILYREALSGAALAPAGGELYPPAEPAPHAADALPQVADGNGELRVRSAPRLASVGIGPFLTAMAAGLLLFSAGIALGRGGNPVAGQVAYVTGLAVLFVPAALAATLLGLVDRQRRWVVLALLPLLQLCRVIQQPTRFADHDELAHATNLRHLLEHDHLFSPNSILPVTAYYPGLATITGAVQQLTGLPGHTSALVVTTAARIVLAVAIFGLIRTITRSERVAAVAVLVYACSPQILFFNSQYSYQTLALPLGLVTLYLLARRNYDGLGTLVAPGLTAFAMALTHHLTSAVVIAILVAWLLLTLLVGRSERRWRQRAADLLIILVVTAAGIVVALRTPGNPTLVYLVEAFQSAVSGASALFERGQTKTLFLNPGGVVSSPFERVVMLAATAITGICLLLAWWRARAWWSRRRNRALPLLLILLSMLFVLQPLGHLAQSTGEIADRSTTFAFIGIAFVLGWWLWQRRMTRRTALVATSLASVAFLGAVMLGGGPLVQQVPGRFWVGADARSIDRDNIAAVDWMRGHVGEDTSVFGNRVNMLLTAAYGGLTSATQIGTGFDASEVLLNPAVTAQDLKLIRTLPIDLLVTDLRDGTALPTLGYYVANGEWGQTLRKAPVSRAALRKYDRVAKASRVYTNGNVTIYELAGVGRGGG